MYSQSVGDLELEQDFMPSVFSLRIKGLHWGADCELRLAVAVV